MSRVAQLHTRTRERGCAQTLAPTAHSRARTRTPFRAHDHARSDSRARTRAYRARRFLRQ